MNEIDTSISRFAEKHQFEFMDICICPDGSGCLRYNIRGKKYFEEGSCNREFPCAILQIHKHKIDVIYRKRQLLYQTQQKQDNKPQVRKTPFDQTMDKFLRF